MDKCLGIILESKLSWNEPIENQILAGAGGTDSGRGRGFFGQDMEPSQLAEVMHSCQNVSSWFNIHWV